MPREITAHGQGKLIGISAKAIKNCEDHFRIEVIDAISSRAALESEWREVHRMYEGNPIKAINNFPIENAPNTEITIGAIATDSISAQAQDLIFSANPIVTCRPMVKGKKDDLSTKKAKALQRLANWMVKNEINFRDAVEDLVIDDTKLGSAFLYTPMIKRVIKNHRTKVVSENPVIISMPPEDVIAPGGSWGDIEQLPWIALRFYRSEGELKEYAQSNGWDIKNILPVSNKNWVRSRYEALGKQPSGTTSVGKLYDIYDLYAYYDIDGDGIPEDLFITYNHTAGKILKIGWNPYGRRIISRAFYQKRPHLFYGLGVMEMLRPYEKELTDVHNWGTLNALLANVRMWATSADVQDNLKIYPNRQVVCEDVRKDIIGLAMADVHPSIWMAQTFITQLAEKRVGMNELSSPSSGQASGSRTPGITALTMLGQANKRFVPAFDSMREAVADAVKQCLYRYQEKLSRGSKRFEKHLMNILGEEDGALAIATLEDERFDEQIVTELTASSASINAEADKQNALLLANILSTYYDKILQLAAIIDNPQTTPGVKEVAQKIVESSGELVDRTIRVFDQVRDPDTFIVELPETPLAAGGGNEIGDLLNTFIGGQEGGTQ